VLDEVDDPQVVLGEVLDGLVVVVVVLRWCSTRWMTLRWSWGRCWMGWVVTFRCPLDGLDGLDG
jgi:hypothetical protein